MKFYLESEWFVRTNTKVVEAIKLLEESNWPTPSQYGQFFCEPDEWYEMPVVRVLDSRISFFREGDWNEPEMGEEWAAWDEWLPVEMAKVTLAVDKSYSEIREWEDHPERASRVFQVTSIPSKVDIHAYFRGEQDWLQHHTWDEIVAEMQDLYGTVTTAETLRKEASLFRRKTRNWIDERLAVKESRWFECWKRNAIRFDRDYSRYLEEEDIGNA